MGVGSWATKMSRLRHWGMPVVLVGKRGGGRKEGGFGGRSTPLQANWKTASFRVHIKSPVVFWDGCYVGIEY
jgi:hypothetical protein